MHGWRALAVLLALGASLAAPAGAQAEGYEPSHEGVTRLAFLADAQHEGERPTLRTMVEHLEQANTSLLLYGGDTSYGWGEAPEDWVDALGPYAEPGRMLFVYGNHDGGASYRVYQPTTPPDHTWWSERVGDVVVVGLDTNRGLANDSAQVRWLRETLAEHREDFVILMMHMPWWVPNVYHEERYTFQGDPELFDALVESNDVDLVLGGHQHYYARHDIGGTTHLITGPADAQTRDVPTQVAEEARASARQETAVLLNASACGVRGWTLDPAGDVIDTFEAPTHAKPFGELFPLDGARACVGGSPDLYARPLPPEALRYEGGPHEQDGEASLSTEEANGVKDDEESELPGWLEEGIGIYSAVAVTVLLVTMLHQRRSQR